MSSDESGLQKFMVAARTERKRSRRSALRDCLGARFDGCVSMMRSSVIRCFWRLDASQSGVVAQNCLGLLWAVLARERIAVV